MHTLNFNRVFADLNPETRRWSRPGSSECELVIGRIGSRPLRRKCWIAACAPERNGVGGESKSPSQKQNPSASSLFSRSQTYALLKQQMEVAAKSEDYEEAARIRDSLRTFEEEEPVLRLKRLMKEAIADERFEDAARYRDELKEIAPSALLKCASDATTLGIRVQVRSVYIEGRSHPSKGQYFFAYRIRITNNSDRPVQLLRRHWIITDANGKTENFWGVGVIAAGMADDDSRSSSSGYSYICSLISLNKN
uniref:UVR domain-containing protein n=1 Tax=Kalanchoe fedtschenkoi TaxID=63787 RepID=A0A7N0VLP4_KALFE